MEVELCPIEGSSCEKIVYLSVYFSFFQLSIQSISLENLFTRSDDEPLASIMIFPDWHRRTPITRTGNAPVWSGLNPLRKSSIFQIFWKPIDFFIRLKKCIFLRLDIDKPS